MYAFDNTTALGYKSVHLLQKAPFRGRRQRGVRCSRHIDNIILQTCRETWKFHATLQRYFGIFCYRSKTKNARKGIATSRYGWSASGPARGFQNKKCPQGHCDGRFQEPSGGYTAIRFQNKKCPQGHCDYYLVGLGYTRAIIIWFQNKKCPQGHCDSCNAASLPRFSTMVPKQKMPARALRPEYYVGKVGIIAEVLGVPKQKMPARALRHKMIWW